MVALVNLSKTYSNTQIFKNINHEFVKGINLIEGENGSGKTTLINIIGAHDLDYEGEILAMSRISYVPDILEIFGDIKTKVFCKSLLKELKVSFEEQCQYFYQLFDIKDLFIKKINQLSLGQKKKIILFITLLKKSDTWVLDEPFSGLDEESSIKLQKFLDSQTRKTIILSTHRSDLALSFKSRIKLS